MDNKEISGSLSSGIDHANLAVAETAALLALTRDILDILDGRVKQGTVSGAASVASSVATAVRFNSTIVSAEDIGAVARKVYDATIEKGHAIKLPREVFILCARTFPNIEAEKATDMNGRIVGFTENAVNRVTKAYGVYQIRPTISTTLRSRYGLGLITDHFASQLVYLLFLTDEHYRMLVREHLLADHLERTVVQLYLMHFLGAPSGLALLRAPEQKRAFELAGPSVINANPLLFKGVQTVGDLVLRVHNLLRTSALP